MKRAKPCKGKCRWLVDLQYPCSGCGHLRETQLAKENANLRRSIECLIEIYAPAQRKAVLRREHLPMWHGGKAWWVR